jgi:hypothetical protein
LYVASARESETVAKVYKMNIQTGKMDFWKSFGEEKLAGSRGLGGLRLSADGSAYAYVYVVTLSQAYVVTGLK